MKKIGSIGIVGLFLSLFALLAGANGPGGVRKQIEASMLVTGTIEVTPEGNVGSYSIDKADKLPQGVMAFVDQNIEQWQFQQVVVEGKPVGVRNKMSLRIVAKKREDGNYLIRLHGASFDPMQVQENHEVKSTVMKPPGYPMTAAATGVSGIVYLVLKINKSGQVEDVVPEQVNLRFVDSENQMQRWRNTLAGAAMSAARKWQFSIPQQGSAADQAYWSVRVPVDFTIGERQPKYGQWEPYIPGPRQHYPWAERDEASFSPDALADGGVYMRNPNSLKLITPLGDG